MPKRILATVLALFTLLATTTDLAAQSSQPAGDPDPGATALPDPLTPEAVQALVARMSDEDVRAMLLDRLDAVALQAEAGAPANTGLLSELSGVWTRFYSDIFDAVVKVPLLAAGMAKSFSNFAASQGGAGGVATLFWLIAVALVAGFAVEKLIVRLTKPWQKADPDDSDDSLRASLGFLFRRFMREMIGLVGFYIGLRIVGALLLDDHQIAFAGPFVFYLIWLPRVSAAVARLVLAPNRPRLRLVNVSDHWARYLCRNLVGLVLLGGFTVFIVGFNARNGVSMADTRLAFWLNTAVHVYIGIIAWVARDGLSDMMRGTDPDNTAYDEWAARIYPYFAVGVSAGMWLVVQIVAGYGQTGLLATAPHFTTMFWLLMAPALDTMIRGLVRHLQPPMIGEGPVAEVAHHLDEHEGRGDHPGGDPEEELGPGVLEGEDHDDGEGGYNPALAQQILHCVSLRDSAR